MVNYYDILKVSPRASGTEIKSAYRRLARKLHPDKNIGSEETALKFAAIAEAYEVLGNPKQRIQYDQRLVDAKFSSNGTGDSFFDSTNPHVRRWRQMVYEKRYNDIIDRMIAEERQEAMAFQKVVYPLVALIVGCLLTTALRPRIFFDSDILGRIIIVSLFIVGIIHIIGRVRDGFERFTQPDDDIHESILDDNERKHKPVSRLAAAAAIIGGVMLALGIGLIIGIPLRSPGSSFPLFSDNLKPEFLFYPPIITFFVDMMHTIASKFER